MVGGEIETLSFALRLKPGSGPAAVAEYKRRHDEIWPEMRAALLDAGVIEYEIHLEPASLLLFAWMRVRRDHHLSRLPGTDTWRRWQAHMSDLLVMEDGSPMRVELAPMFRLAADAGG